MPKNREQLRQEYINSLDSFISQNPTVGQLDTAKFRDFLIGLVEHESGFNPTAKQGSYFGWYQTNKLDSDPNAQHMNAFNHLNDLFNNTITKDDIKKARSLGINDSALMLKYWNQGNRVNNYLWNNKDSADGLGTLISNYGNDLTMPLDIYNYAMDNLYGDYTVKKGDNWFNIQKRVRMPGRDYATAGKDLWNMQQLAGRPYGSLKIGQSFTFGQPNDIINKNLIQRLRTILPLKHPNLFNRVENTNVETIKRQTGGIIYKPFISTNENEYKNDLIYKPLDKKEESYLFDDYTPKFPVEPVDIYTKSNQVENSTEELSETKEPIVETPIITKTVSTAETPKVEKSSVSKDVKMENSTGKIYTSKEKEQFKEDMYNAYYKELLSRGLNDKLSDAFAKKLTTQDILESRWGQSSLSKYFNFGGIKDFRSNSNAAVLSTYEYEDGQKKEKKQPFRKFNNLEEYIKYKIDLVERNWDVFKYTPESYFDNLVKGKLKYATSPTYVNTLNGLHKSIWG